MANVDREAKLKEFRKEIETLPNVIGVGYDPEEERFVALVEKKIEESKLDENQLVANNTSLSSSEHGVVEVGHIKAHSLEMDTTAEDESETVEPESSAKIRPVRAGAEEQPHDRNWVGTGSFIARVTDPSKGQWTDDVSKGDVVRLSNWHVYVGDEFDPHRPIHQPFRGGEVGELVGSVPIENGVTVDVAARLVSKHDGWGTVGLDTADDGTEYGRLVVSDIVSGHRGATVTKSGRTTDVTTAEINLIDVSVNVNYGTKENPNLIRIDDCVITTDLGDGGDSGSAVYLKENGALCGLYFAGSDTVGVFVQIKNVTEALGVEPITNWNDEQSPIEYGRVDDDLQRFKDDLIEYIENWNP